MRIEAYRGFIPKFWYDEDLNIYHGHAVGKDVQEGPLFQGKTFDELNSDFKKSVDNYLEKNDTLKK